MKDGGEFVQKGQDQVAPSRERLFSASEALARPSSTQTNVRHLALEALARHCQTQSDTRRKKKTLSSSIMKFLSPYTVMLTINLEPIYGIILAVIVFKEKERACSRD